MIISFLFPFAFHFSLFTAICKASPDSHFTFFAFLFHGDGLDPCLLYNVTNLTKARGGGWEEQPMPEARGGSREEQPHVQGAVAARAQEGLEELSHRDVSLHKIGVF